MTWKIELIFVPVTDVDRAKEFYVKIGFNADHDHTPREGLRFVQMTPPGSACSIAFGTGLDIPLEPGQQKTVQIVVPNADEAKAQLEAVASRPRASKISGGAGSCGSTTPTATRGPYRSCPTTRRRTRRAERLRSSRG